MLAAVRNWVQRKLQTRRIGILEHLLRYLLGYKLTKAGQTLALAAILSSVLGMSSLAIPVYQLVSALGYVLLVSLAAGYLMRPRLKVDGGFPEKASAGNTVSAEFTITNMGKRAAHDIGVHLLGGSKSLEATGDETHIACIEPGETKTLTLQFIPRKRGMHAVPRAVPYTGFPFNLWRTRARNLNRKSPPPEPKPLLVLPAFQPASGIDLPQSRRYQPGGLALTSHIGESLEYIGNREYRPGDSMRRIDFRSWARLAKPVVREFNEEYYNRIALVVDTYIPPGAVENPQGFPALEAAISLSAAIADALSEGEHVIDIFAAGPELYVFRAGRHTAHLENVFEILACINACRTNPFDTLGPALLEELHGISTAVCVFLDWDETRESLVQTALEAGCDTKVFILSDSDTTASSARAEVLIENVRTFTPHQIGQGAYEIL